MDSSLDRRDVLRLLTASALAGPLQLAAAQPERPLYFSKDEFALLDVLTEHIIPRDAHSGGAHAAGVAGYIDRSVAEAFLPEDKERWKQGLAEVNRLSIAEGKKPFLKSSKQKQIALLQQLAKGEADPKSEGEKFFKYLKSATVFAYYSSRLGIHDEMEYKGNVILEQFAGYDAV
jgi:hypothetical protein